VFNEFSIILNAQIFYHNYHAARTNRFASVNGTPCAAKLH
jgi:hypothetical protein